DAMRGHAESKRKRDLSREAWKVKKAAAREENRPHGNAVPMWLECVGAKQRGNRKDFGEADYVLKPDAADTIRKIFEWSMTMGAHAVTRRLDREKVPTFFAVANNLLRAAGAAVEELGGTVEEIGKAGKPMTAAAILAAIVALPDTEKEALT